MAERTRGLVFEDIGVGATFESRSRVVTAEDVRAFADLTGDHNPLHVDPEFAASTPFGSVIAHGLLGLSLIVGLIEEIGIFHGTALAFLGIDEWQFRAPIFVDDEIHARMTIVDKRPSTRDASRGVVQRRLELFNADGKLLQTGEAAVLVRRRRGEVA